MHPLSAQSPSSPARFSRCFSTLGSPDLTWGETLEFASAHHFDGIELRCLAGQVISPATLSELLPNAAVCKRALDERSLRFQMLGTSVKLLNRTPGEIEDLVRLAEFADAVDCPWLRIFDGGKANEPISEADLDATRTFLATWSARRRALGIKADIAVETHDAFASLDQTKAVLGQLPSFAVLWDTHHTWRFGESLAEYYRLVSDRAVHFHLKDSVNVPSKRKPFTYVEPGTGEFPWGELQQVIGDAKAKGFISLEWEKHWNPELAPIDDVVSSFIEITDSW